MKPIIVGINSQRIKRIAMTCKCGRRFISHIPGEVLDGGAAPVLECECGQNYIIHGGKIRRLEHGQLGKEIEKKQLPGPIDAELNDGDATEPPVTQDGRAWEMPSSKLVN